jgi:signal transduction histidine kinase
VCGLIEDLLAVERLAKHRGLAPAVSTDIMEVIHEAIGQQREALIEARSRIRVLKKEEVDRPRGPWDRGYLLRVFGNLLRNAAIHAPGAPIDIVFARKGNVLGIVFADAGPGLPTPMKCEEPASFRRGSTRGASRGLGHWIVRRAVERLGGQLRIRSSPGQGVAFNIELPDLEDQHQRGDAQARASERREVTPCQKVSVRLQRCA